MNLEESKQITENLFLYSRINCPHEEIQVVFLQVTDYEIGTLQCFRIGGGDILRSDSGWDGWHGCEMDGCI